MYGSFYECALDVLAPLKINTFPFSKRYETKYKCKIFGPTTHSIDRIANEFLLPDLEVGECIIHTDMGAYTVAMFPGHETFSGLKKAQIKYFLN